MPIIQEKYSCIAHKAYILLKGSARGRGGGGGGITADGLLGDLFPLSVTESAKCTNASKL